MIRSSLVLRIRHLSILRKFPQVRDITLDPFRSFRNRRDNQSGTQSTIKDLIHGRSNYPGVILPPAF